VYKRETRRVFIVCGSHRPSRNVVSKAVRIRNIKKLLESSYNGPVAYAYISSRLKAGNSLSTLSFFLALDCLMKKPGKCRGIDRMR